MTAGRTAPPGGRAGGRHRLAERALSALSGLFVLAAAGFLGYPLLTNLYQGRVQARLGRQLVSPKLKSEYQRGSVPAGSSLTRVIIPSIGVNVVVVQGTSTTDLEAGAGHYPWTPMPCSKGDVAIAGHRTTYGKPFNRLNLLHPGSRIILSTPIGSCAYSVARQPFRVLPNDTAAVANTPGAYTLTLTSCAPRGSASHRIVVKAVLDQTATMALAAAPVGAAGAK